MAKRELPAVVWFCCDGNDDGDVDGDDVSRNLAMSFITSNALVLTT